MTRPSRDLALLVVLLGAWIIGLALLDFWR